jgi:hypothetical protein
VVVVVTEVVPVEVVSAITGATGNVNRAAVKASAICFFKVIPPNTIVINFKGTGVFPIHLINTIGLSQFEGGQSCNGIIGY